VSWDGTFAANGVADALPPWPKKSQRPPIPVRLYFRVSA
jgi:hypothetical protein